MSALPQVLPAGGQVIAVVPQSIEEIFRLSKGVVQSGLAPYALTGKTETEADITRATSAVAIVIMAGAELGLPPMVALRSFTAINGRPALYGDGLINVVRRSGRAKVLKVSYTMGTDYKLFIRGDKLPTPETDEETAEIRKAFDALPVDERTGGYCEAERADTGERKVVVFTVAQAKRAGLWQAEPLVWKDVWSGPKGNRTSKREQVPNDSPWYRYPERMLGWRAAGFCLRELFGDVLGGITDDWEAREIGGMVDITPAEPTRPSDILPPVPEDDPPKGGKTIEPDPSPPADQKEGGAAEQGATAGTAPTYAIDGTLVASTDPLKDPINLKPGTLPAENTVDPSTGQLHKTDHPEGGENEVKHPATGETMTNTKPASSMDAYWTRLNEELSAYEGEDEFEAAWIDMKVEDFFANNPAALDKAKEVRAEHLDRIAKIQRQDAVAAGQGDLLAAPLLPEVPSDE